MEMPYYSLKATWGGWSGGAKNMLSLSERSHWVVKDVEDRIKKHCSYSRVVNNMPGKSRDQKFKIAQFKNWNRYRSELKLMRTEFFKSPTIIFHGLGHFEFLITWLALHIINYSTIIWVIFFWKSQFACNYSTVRVKI